MSALQLGTTRRIMHLHLTRKSICCLLPNPNGALRNTWISSLAKWVCRQLLEVWVWWARRYRILENQEHTDATGKGSTAHPPYNEWNDHEAKKSAVTHLQSLFCVSERESVPITITALLRRYVSGTDLDRLFRSKSLKWLPGLEVIDVGSCCLYS